MADAGAAVVGVNCEQEPDRILAITREMRNAVGVPIAAQPAAFRTTDAIPCFTRLPQFPDEMEAIQLPRSSFERFAETAKDEGIQFLGGCCGCNARLPTCVCAWFGDGEQLRCIGQRGKQSNHGRVKIGVVGSRFEADIRAASIRFLPNLFFSGAETGRIARRWKPCLEKSIGLCFNH